METEYADGDAEMEAELDDLLASDDDEQKEEEGEEEGEEEEEEEEEEDASQHQPPSAGDDGLVDELDEVLDEEDEDLNLPTDQPEGPLPEAPPVEEGYLPADGTTHAMSVYDRYAEPGDAFVPPGDPYGPPYGEEGGSGYPHDEHQGPYHDHGDGGGYHDEGGFHDEGGYMPRQEAQPSTSRQERNAADEQLQQRNMQIFKAMTPEQLSRYEAYRRSLCPAPKVKKLMQHIMGANVVIHPQLVLAMRGVAKMYVGEIIECARQVASDMGHKGPLLPCHVQRAYGILESTNRVPRRDGPRSKLRM